MEENIQVINPFYDVEQIKERTDNLQLAIDSLRNLKEMSVGEGSKVLRVDKNGLWLGAEKFADAPFSVDMLGNAVINSIDLSGYLQIGQAAADVNAGSTLIEGGKVEANYFLAQADTGQTLTGTINVGVSNILIDGVNNQILVNDGTRNIIHIGYQSGGY